jgi:hypothetical protein
MSDCASTLIKKQSGNQLPQNMALNPDAHKALPIISSEAEKTPGKKGDILDYQNQNFPF